MQRDANTHFQWCTKTWPLRTCTVASAGDLRISKKGCKREFPASQYSAYGSIGNSRVRKGSSCHFEQMDHVQHRYVHLAGSGLRMLFTRGKASVASTMSRYTIS
jgi:hypothetical protein